jgi:hypothetical protein
VPGAEHSAAHVTAPEDYERRTTDFLRVAIEAARREDAAAADDDGPGPIISAPGEPRNDPSIRATPMED